MLKDYTKAATEVVKIRMLAVENVFISQPWEGAR
jgi:hypothetical protein